MRPVPPLSFVLVLVLVVVGSLVSAEEARAMCGCMLRPRPPPQKQGTVATGKIVNRASKVILARDRETTSMTLANDFMGAPAEFGLVVPVPTVVQKKDVKVVDDGVFKALEEKTAPRLVETEDPDPCTQPFASSRGAPMAESAGKGAADAAPRRPRASDYGVKVESHFYAGEYEIAVLSGTDSERLVAWLQRLDYDVPDDAAAVLASYIKQKMFFFVARVHLKEMGNAPRFLRPIQVTYATPKLMLPIRLGMVNADGPQELLLFARSKKGRVEPTNYRTMRLPTGQGELPAFVKERFDDVYRAAFIEATRREDRRVVFVEAVHAEGSDVVTRIHFEYDASGFPEDLVLQETADREPFVATFRSRKHHLGPARCDAHAAYLRSLPPLLDREAQVLANLTGWPIDEVRARMPRP